MIQAKSNHVPVCSGSRCSPGEADDRRFDVLFGGGDPDGVRAAVPPLRPARPSDVEQGELA